MARVFGMGFFGVKVWSRDFFGVLIFAPFYHPCHVKSRIPPPLGVECWPGACSWEFLVGVLSDLSDLNLHISLSFLFIWPWN